MRKAIVQNTASLFILILPIGFMVSCASPQRVHGAVSHERVFPYGNYRHDVSLSISMANGQTRQFNFIGIVQLKPETTQIVGLSSFGTTVFKLTEDLRTSDVEVKIYVEEMKHSEPRIRDYYGVLREILNSPLNPSSSRLKWLNTNTKGYPIEMETVGLADKTLLKIIRFDPNDVPVEFSMDSQKFHISVKVTEYEI